MTGMHGLRMRPTWHAGVQHGVSYGCQLDSHTLE